MPWYFYNNRGVLKTEGIEDPFPAGTITSYVHFASPAPTIPAGWLLCNGTTPLTNDYKQLARILMYPAVPTFAPLETFTLPDLNTRFPVGASGSYPLRSTGGNAQHPHTLGTHTHSNSHTHGVTTTHQHSIAHKHHVDGTPHQHGAGTYKTPLDASAAKEIEDTDGGATVAPKGVGSGDRHFHGISGTTGDPNVTTILEYDSGLLVNLGGSGTTDSKAVSLDASSSTIDYTSGNVLPPYLNVYFIVKWQDFSGMYI